MTTSLSTVLGNANKTVLLEAWCPAFIPPSSPVASLALIQNPCSHHPCTLPSTAQRPPCSIPTWLLSRTAGAQAPSPAVAQESEFHRPLGAMALVSQLAAEGSYTRRGSLSALGQALDVTWQSSHGSFSRLAGGSRALRGIVGPGAPVHLPVHLDFLLAMLTPWTQGHIVYSSSPHSLDR